VCLHIPLFISYLGMPELEPEPYHVVDCCQNVWLSALSSADCQTMHAFRRDSLAYRQFRNICHPMHSLFYLGSCWLTIKQFRFMQNSPNTLSGGEKGNEVVFIRSACSCSDICGNYTSRWGRVATFTPGISGTDTSRRPRGTLYLQKVALTSPTSGGLSVGMVRSRTQATEFSLVLYRDVNCLPPFPSST
jgi:hypothetical protein